MACVFKTIARITVLLLICRGANAQNNAVPFLNQSLLPASVAPGSKSFPLIVTGTGFAHAAVVKWNGAPLSTKFVSSSRLKAAISAAEVSAAKTASITVTNPAPGGGTSNVVFFPVTESSSAIGMAISQPFPDAYAVAVGDFNNDGNQDVAWVSTSGLNLSLGDGNGGFQAPIPSEGACELQIVTGDFNGDGKLDLACLTFGTCTVLLGNGDGTFTQSFYVDPFDGGASGLATADFNQDGHLDLYIAGWETGPMFFDIYLGNGDGTFNYASEYLTGEYDGYGVTAQNPAIGDFNRDGYLDLVVAGNPSDNEGTIEIFLGGPNGQFSESGTISAFDPVNLAAADVNNDGKLDLVTDSGCAFLGNGNGTFGLCIAISYGEVAGIADFNGDGELDIAEGNGSASVSLGAGNGTFPSSFSFVAGSGSFLYPGGIADFNNDGELDIVVPGGYVFIQTTVDLEPVSMAFGTLTVGTTSAPQKATLTNVGSSSLAIKGVGIAGTGAKNFSEKNDCGASLAAGSSCTISVTFAPLSGGSFTPSLTVSYEGTASPQRVSLSGKAEKPSI